MTTIMIMTTITPTITNTTSLRMRSTEWPTTLPKSCPTLLRLRRRRRRRYCQKPLSTRRTRCCIRITVNNNRPLASSKHYTHTQVEFFKDLTSHKLEDFRINGAFNQGDSTLIHLKNEIKIREKSGRQTNGFSRTWIKIYELQTKRKSCYTVLRYKVFFYRYFDRNCMFEEQRYGFLTIVKSFSLKATIGRCSYIGIFIFESHRFNAARYYFFIYVIG